MAPVRVKFDPADHAVQVEACLATVMDPELDEAVTELGFITEVELVGAGEVHIGFRLPTYWCAANFAFLMADDMRRAVLTLPWVSQVQVQLHEHMYAEAINAGVATGGGFQAAFGAAAEGGLEALRTTFLVKAFQRRQEALLQHLLDAGLEAAVLVAMDRNALLRLTLDAEGENLVGRYMQRRDEAGDGELAFVNSDGQALATDGLPRYLRGLRRVGVNAEFNGALCRGLLAVRDGAQQGASPTQPQFQPIHFVRQPAERIAVS